MEIALILALITLIVLSSAAESALISISQAKVRSLFEAKKPGSRNLKKLKDKQDNTLIVILVCNTFTNVLLSIYSTVYFESLFGDKILGIVAGVLTFILLLFGEVLPKSYATSHASTVALAVATPIYYIGIIISPVIWLFELFVKLFFKLFHIKKQQIVSDEELIAMLSIGEEEGSIQKNERDIIENVLEFNDIQTSEIMTPRIHIDAMHEDYNLKEAAEFMLNHTHTRIPVYRDTIDDIVGVVTYKEMLEELHEESDIHTTLRQINLRPPLKVENTMRVHTLFKLFTKKQAHLAIVLDEKGSTVGLVTMEDLIEELVGEIMDEKDEPDEEIKKITDGQFEVSGRIHLDQLAEITGIELEYPEYKTLSFLILEKLGRMPTKGEKLQIGDWQFSVSKIYKHTIIKVLLKKTPVLSKP